MDIKYIAFSMVIILAILFISAPILRKKEKQKGSLEVQYFEKLKSYEQNKSDESKKELIEALEKYFQFLGFSDEQIDKKKKDHF